MTGATVHFVNEVPDGGRIILQKAVEVEEGDTPETLQRRVMEQAEWKLLPAAVEKVSSDLLRRRTTRMSGYENLNLCELLKNNAYPGRGIVVGKPLPTVRTPSPPTSSWAAAPTAATASLSACRTAR